MKIGGWTIRDTRRKQIVPGVRLNYSPLKLLAALLDGPGGKRLSEGLSTTLGSKRAHWNSRTDRYTVDYPGHGSASRPANLRKPRRRSGGAR